MLIKRCPNLEHLAIDGHSLHAPVDAHGLLCGRWSNLHSLLIGDVVLNWHIGLNPSLGKPFRTASSNTPNMAAPSPKRKTIGLASAIVASVSSSGDGLTHLAPNTL